MRGSKQVDRNLKQMGFGGIDDPNIMKQLAFMVKDHDQFRKLLTTVEPEKRTVAYESLRPHLRFPAWPLDVYMAKAAELAANRLADQAPLDVLASDAIERNRREEESQGVLTLDCHRCTKVQAYPGLRRTIALGYAMKDGWTFREGEDKKEVSICPECSGLYKAGNA
jgi:hypothetical protein